MSAYLDLYLRQSLQQSQPDHAGGSLSPDIVPWGTSADPDPGALANQANLQRDLGRPLVAEGDNYVYVRVGNSAASSVKGLLFLGAAPATFLCWPDQVTTLKNDDGEPDTEVQIAANAFAAALPAFRYAPACADATLVAWVRTPQHPKPPPSALKDVGALRDFLVATPGYAQRSVGFGWNAAHSYVFTGSYAQRDAAANMMILIDWRDCDPQWRLSLLPAAGAGDIAIEPFTLASASNSLVQPVRLDAGYAATLTLCIEAADTASAPDAQISVSVLLVQSGALDQPHDPSDTASYVSLGGHAWRAQAPTAPIATPVRPPSNTIAGTHHD